MLHVARLCSGGVQGKCALAASSKLGSTRRDGLDEKAVRDTLPHAKIVFDHFHIAKLANEALNDVRRALMREAADKEAKAQIKGTMWATLHRMDNATDEHHEILARLRPEQPLGRAFLLEESLLDILRRAVAKPERALQGWLAWAARSRLKPFVRLGRTIRDHLDGAVALLEERIANGLAEGMNNKIRLLSHRAYGFHSATPLIATIYLCCGGIALPDLQLVSENRTSRVSRAGEKHRTIGAWSDTSGSGAPVCAVDRLHCVTLPRASR